MSSSTAQDEEIFSDEDMFSPKKRVYPEEYPEVLASRAAPGSKDLLVNRFRKLLTGIPPPPDHTNPDFQLDKMLALWYTNQCLVWEGGVNVRNSPSEDQMDLGVCLNRDDSCEEFESLGRHICERYIWSETNAVTSTVFIKLTQSAKKRRKANGWGKSPKTRVSYLTRRMTTFQKDNIAMAVASSKSTQILITKGNDNKKGTSKKAADIKGKRALFTSPDNLNKFRTPEQGKNRRLIRQLLVNTSPVIKDKTRETFEDRSQSLERRRCSRSLFNTSNSTDAVDAASEKPTANSSNSLSKEHRQKMLWAVSNALKAVKIRMCDPEFKIFASQLFKATVGKWRPNLTSSANKKVSTSDAMLATAKGLVEGITGRQMSPKSAKKTAPLEESDKSPTHDENEPPQNRVMLDPIHRTPPKTSMETGVFPLDVGLEKKLDPGGVTPQKMGSVASSETKPDAPKVQTPLTRKRKREDSNTDRNLVESIPQSLCTRQLRSYTPCKSSTPSKRVEFSDRASTPCKTPNKTDPSPTSSSVREFIEKTPENNAKKRILSEWKSPVHGTHSCATRMVTRQLSYCTPQKTEPSTSPADKLLPVRTSPSETTKCSSDADNVPRVLRSSLRRQSATSESPRKKVSTPSKH